MTGAREAWLVAGGALSLAAAALHLACIVGGPAWVRAFGAGERMVEAGRIGPILVTVGIAAALAGFGVYAWSGAGLLPRLPLLRAALVAITAIYLLRGLVLFVPGALRRPDLSPRFLFWSSAVVLGFGLVHLVGTWRCWPALQGNG